MAYAPERREAVLSKMLPPNNMTIAELARTEGISEQTLYGWRTRARKEGRLMPDADLTPEGWTSRDKFAAVMETAAMSEAEIGEYCREKGLHAAQLAAWRAACERANDWDQSAATRERAATKASDKKLKQVQRERDRMEKALAEAAALLVMREKLQVLRSRDEDD